MKTTWVCLHVLLAHVKSTATVPQHFQRTRLYKNASFFILYSVNLFSWKLKIAGFEIAIRNCGEGLSNVYVVVGLSTISPRVCASLAKLQVSGRAVPAGCVTANMPEVPTLTECCPGAPSTLPCLRQRPRPGWPCSSCPHTHGQAASGHCLSEPCTSGNTLGL